MEDYLYDRKHLAGGSRPTFRPPPIGTTVFFAGKTVPTNWMERNGASFDASKWPELSEVLESSTLPDDRGLFIRGYDPASICDVEGATRGFRSFQEGSFLVKDYGNSVTGFNGGDTTQQLKWDSIQDASFVPFYSWSETQNSQKALLQYGTVGISRPKNRNYLAVIYAGPPVS